MPRQPRYAICGLPQHVIQRGNNRVPTFYSESDYLFYRTCLGDACKLHGTRVHAYVLMTNHVHLLLTPDTADGIAKVMQSVGRKFVRYINDTYRRTGTLWEGRYKASLVDSESYLLACYRYIESNPVRAGMTHCPSHYRWSSYRHHVGLLVDPLITDHPVYCSLGATAADRHSAYRTLCETPEQSTVLQSIRDSANGCLVLGTDRFKDQIERVLARRVHPGKPGRPRKEIAV